MLSPLHSHSPSGLSASPFDSPLATSPVDSPLLGRRAFPAPRLPSSRLPPPVHKRVRFRRAYHGYASPCALCLELRAAGAGGGGGGGGGGGDGDSGEAPVMGDDAKRVDERCSVHLLVNGGVRVGGGSGPAGGERALLRQGTACTDRGFASSEDLLGTRGALAREIRAFVRAAAAARPPLARRPPRPHPTPFACAPPLTRALTRAPPLTRALTRAPPLTSALTRAPPLTRALTPSRGHRTGSAPLCGRLDSASLRLRRAAHRLDPCPDRRVHLSVPIRARLAAA